MNILVVGNVLKDVYLNLDTRTERFETDKHGTGWLDLAFDASEHRFFNRTSSLGGAAVSLEVLEKLGLKAAISNANLTIEDDGLTATSPINTYRYILVADDEVCYLSPTGYYPTTFTPPPRTYDYLYIDRSAEITAKTAKAITNYLEQKQNTKLVIYARNFNNPNLNSLLSHADLIFVEESTDVSDAAMPQDILPNKLVYISDEQLSYLNIVERISVDRIDKLTHLSAYSVVSATILGGFVLGYSVEDSLKIARANVENAKLNSALSLSELKELAKAPHKRENLELIAANLVLYPKGILAADESGGSIHKKFEQLDIPDTYDNRRDYRNIFFTTPDLEKYVNGVILFDETARQFADNGQNFVDFLTSRRIIPGIKVDQGLEQFPDSEETFTKGLDGLTERLKEYHQMGLRFAKWRAAFNLRLDDRGEAITPTDHAIEENCEILATYAKECQAAGLVPIVEPELVYDGDYDIRQSAKATSRILDCLFTKLAEAKVNLRACILKVNMILAGKQQKHQSTFSEVGAETARVLRRRVPRELAGVVFLSGGQSPEQATSNLAAIIENGPFPWPVTFSFARALQDPALYAWAGDNNSADNAKQAFKERLIKNTDALKMVE